jgi:hypothetical protein
MNGPTLMPAPTPTLCFPRTTITATCTTCCGGAGGPVAVMNRSDHTTRRMFVPGADGIYSEGIQRDTLSYELLGLVQWPTVPCSFCAVSAFFFFCIFCIIDQLHNKCASFKEHTRIMRASQGSSLPEHGVR